MILSVRVVEQISLSHEGTMETFIYRNGYLRTSSRKFTMDMKACKGRLLDEVRQRGTYLCVSVTDDPPSRARAPYLLRWCGDHLGVVA